MNHANSANTHVLIVDLKRLISDAQDMLQLIADQSSESVTDLRFRLEDKIAKHKKDLARLQAATAVKVTEAGRAADDYVHHEPWTAIGIAAGLAFVLGALVCYSRRD